MKLKKKSRVIFSISRRNFFKLFIKYGKNSLKKITGPFSFLIICLDTGIVHGGRDLFGQRPLYYCNNNDYFIVANNIDIFLNLEFQENLMMKKFFNLYSMSIIKIGKTFYRQINKVNGGYSFTFKNDNINLEIHESRDLVNRNSNKSDLDLIEDFKDQYLNVISSIVKKVDENYATTLSGGLDSSSISLIASYCDKKTGLFAFGSFSWPIK